MTLSDSAISKIQASNKLIGLLMGLFDKHQNTIEKWLDKEHAMHAMLMTPQALQIISELTGMSQDKILEKTPAKRGRKINENS